MKMNKTLSRTIIYLGLFLALASAAVGVSANLKPIIHVTVTNNCH